MTAAVKPRLIRDPEEWAREWGWHSPTKCRNDARALRNLATIIRDSLNDEGGEMWARECERIAKRLDPNQERDPAKERHDAG